MKNQEGGSSALVLILAGVIITGIVGSMAYSMTDDVDKQRNTSTDGQQTDPNIGKAMGQLAYNLKNRSKDEKDEKGEKGEWLNKECIEAKITEGSGGSKICIEELNNIKVRIINILKTELDIKEGKSTVAVDYYKEILINKIEDYFESLITSLRGDDAKVREMTDPPPVCKSVTAGSAERLLGRSGC